MACVVAAAFGETQVLRSEQIVNADSFNYVIELDDGQVQQQQGQLRGSGDEQAIVQTGNFAWVSPEGEQIAVQYVADENGYQPTGNHLPTPPPIPDAILRAIQYIESHPKPQ